MFTSDKISCNQAAIGLLKSFSHYDLLTSISMLIWSLSHNSKEVLLEVYSFIAQLYYENVLSISHVKVFSTILFGLHITFSINHIMGSGY